MADQNDREKFIEDTAKIIFSATHDESAWGITGTIDDGSWRRFEKICFRKADQVLSLIEKPKVKLSRVKNPYDTDGKRSFAIHRSIRQNSFNDGSETQLALTKKQLKPYLEIEE